MDKVAQIRQLYFQARPATIERDLARAIEILKSMGSDEERERAAGFMDGLSELRAQWTRLADRQSPTHTPRQRKRQPRG